MMAWLSILGRLSYYCILPLVVVYNTLLRILAPLLHLISNTFHVLYLPLSFLGNFETLYIFFGVAAIIGLFTGIVLHFTSSTLIAVLNLRPTATEDTISNARTARSRREAKQTKTVDEAWQAVLQEKSRAANERMNAALSGSLDFAEFIGKDGKGLLSTTILEEDDDSDVAF